MRHLTSTLFAILASLSAGCSQSESAASEEVDESAAQAIIAGTVIPAETARVSGVVSVITTRGTCTGTLLNSTWVLTAAHCFWAAADTNNDGQLTGAEVTGTAIRFGGNLDVFASEVPASQVIRHPSAQFQVGGSVDVVVVRMAQPLATMNVPENAYQGGRIMLYDGPTESLVGATVTAIGYGCNGGPNDTATCTGRGILRTSSPKVTGSDQTYVRARTGSETGILQHGDSGGPVFLDDYELRPAGAIVAGSRLRLRARYLLGVAVLTSINGAASESIYASYFAFRDWLNETVFGGPPQLRLWQSGQYGILGSLPNSIPSWLGGFVPYGASQSQCYWVTMSYDFEQNYDKVRVAGLELTGQGSLEIPYCGAMPVTVSTDYSVTSAGFTLFGHSPFAQRSASSECYGTPGGWQACVGSGCSVCAEKVRDYPRYYANHPSCAVNTACNGTGYECNANCPAPTEADR